MTIAEDDQDSVDLCPKCMHEVEPGDHFCKACMTPLDSFAASDPVRLIHAEFNTFNKASASEPKLIVLIGMWLLWGPIAVIMLILLIGVGHSLIASGMGPVHGVPEVLLIILTVIAGLGLGGLYFAVGAKYLFKTTRNYVRAKRAGPAVEEEEDSELTREALAAGESDEP